MSIETLKLCGIVILLAPLAGAVVCGVLGPGLLRGRSHWAAILGVGSALVAAVVLFQQVSGAPVGETSASIPLYDWILAGAGTVFRVQFTIDPLTSVMLLTVTGVSLLVVIYSRDYMRNHGTPERGYERFFAFLSLFVFSMCALVLGGNFLLLYLGWEAVGLCSYLLIGFYYGKPSAAAAAKKAFLVNRVGDFGFGLAILLIYLTIGHLDYSTVFAVFSASTSEGGAGNPGMIAAILNIDLTSATQIMTQVQERSTAIALLLLCGACGKSAQLPLHVWLPDAMEGPSPVSALIHAATMVTAGIYMIARCGAIFTSSATAMMVVAIIGATTALFAATIALVQTDMKRILAYSTISQLGYMFLGIGVFAADSAVFHLFTHAFFKALLFLGAGSVMHAMGGIIDLRHFGGLRRVLPWTFLTMLIGSLALAGVPMLAGFFSKDEIIHHALAAHPILGCVGLLTALLTAFYTFRMVFLAFFGQERIPDGVHAHESGRWMLAPLFVLSIGAIGAGYLGAEGTGQFHEFLAPVFEHTFAAHGSAVHVAHAAAAGHGAVEAAHAVTQTFMEKYGLLVLSGSLAFLGIFAAYVLYVSQTWIPGFVKASATRVHRTLWNKYYVDELYDAALVRPTKKIGRICVGLDDYLIDGLLWIVTAIPRGAGCLLRTLQSGMVQGYGLSMAAGVAVIVLLVFWASHSPADAATAASIVAG